MKPLDRPGKVPWSAADRILLVTIALLALFALAVIGALLQEAYQ